MAKNWVITHNSKIIESLPGRKKIAFVDDYLVDIYRDLLLQAGQIGQYDKVKVIASIEHPSGTEVVIDLPPHIIRAQLKEAN